MIELEDRVHTGTQPGLSDAQRAEIQGLLRPPKAKQPAGASFGDADAAGVQPGRLQPTAPWRLPSTGRIRLAEDLVVLAIMGYFGVGLAKVFGVL
jgi:hypothetical protein